MPENKPHAATNGRHADHHTLISITAGEGTVDFEMGTNGPSGESVAFSVTDANGHTIKVDLTTGQAHSIEAAFYASIRAAVNNTAAALDAELRRGGRR